MTEFSPIRPNEAISQKNNIRRELIKETSKYREHPIYSFPEDLGKEEYKDWMRFGIVEFEGVSADAISGVQYTPITKSTSDDNKERLKNSSIFKRESQIVPKIIQGDRPEKINRRFKNFSVTTDIILPMPTALSINNTVGWDNAELGFVGGAFRGGLDITNPLASVSDLIKRDSTGAIGGNIGTVLLSKLANLAVSSTGANGDVVNETANRFILNPHAEVRFQGMDFRKFTFAWKLSPRSEAEVVTITNIIKLLKFHASPDISKDSTQNFLVYPSEFQLQFLHKNDNNGTVNDNEFLPKISQCVCTDVGVNYTSAGLWTAFNSGAPVDLELTLSFSEVEIMTKSRINEGF